MYKNLLSLLMLFSWCLIYAQTNVSSIQSGVSFQWSDIQTDRKDPATIESITVNGSIF
ncbi:hypothetical protein [Winogradskyella sp.]|uniref:hypothetical protein n=1 Tax=Winogradskyella sp. TaxID=1883156 RepID=UPI003F6BC422